MHTSILQVSSMQTQHWKHELMTMYLFMHGCLKNKSLVIPENRENIDVGI